MNYIYKTKDTCSSQISFDINDDILTNIHFVGGCNGNLKSLEVILDSSKASDVVCKFKGITCGRRPTSCTDQLALAIEEAINA